MIRTLDNLSKIELYCTTASKRLRACDVRKITGADVVINATLFDWGTWKPVCDVKSKGKVLSDDRYSYWGLGWNNNDNHFSFDTTANLSKWENMISCVMLIKDGTALHLDVTPDVARPAGRTAIFHTANGKTHIYCDKTSLSPWQLQSKFLARKDVVWALMLDGGGSTQLSQAGTQYVYSSRKVQNYLCFWCRKKVEKEPITNKPKIEINAYSLSKDGDKKISPHFRVREFKCNDGTDPIFIAPKLIRVLEQIRTHFNKPITISSAYRTPPYNKRIGGVSNSQHQYGTAADITIRGVSNSAVADYARTIMKGYGGVGRYKTFTHVDVRDTQANWKG